MRQASEDPSIPEFAPLALMKSVIMTAPMDILSRPDDPAQLDDEALVAQLQRWLGRLRRDPRDLEVRVTVAELQLALRRRDEAAIHYDTAIRAYAQRGELAAALALAERALSLDPGLDQLKPLLAALYARQPRREARPCSPISSGEFREIALRAEAATGEPSSDRPSRGGLWPEDSGEVTKTIEEPLTQRVSEHTLDRIVDDPPSAGYPVESSDELTFDEELRFPDLFGGDLAGDSCPTSPYLRPDADTGEHLAPRETQRRVALPFRDASLADRDRGVEPDQEAVVLLDQPRRRRS